MDYAYQYKLLSKYAAWRIEHPRHPVRAFFDQHIAPRSEAEKPSFPTFNRWIRLWELHQWVDDNRANGIDTDHLDDFLCMGPQAAIAERESLYVRAPRKPYTRRKPLSPQPTIASPSTAPADAADTAPPSPPAGAPTTPLLDGGAAQAILARLDRIDASLLRLTASITRVMDGLAIDGGAS